MKKVKAEQTTYIHKALMGLCETADNMRRMANTQAVDVLKLTLMEVCKGKELPYSIKFSEEDIDERCNVISVCYDNSGSYYDLEVERIDVRDYEHFDFDLVGHIDDHQQETFFSDTIKDGDETELAMNIIRCKL